MGLHSYLLYPCTYSIASRYKHVTLEEGGTQWDGYEIALDDAALSHRINESTFRCEKRRASVKLAGSKITETKP
jgi:hypothetical protein